MASTRLPNHLRRHRKLLGLSQRELAHLLGANGAQKVCHYERFIRVPSLETALACEIIFKVPVRHLFAGLYEKVEQRVKIRVTSANEKIKGKAKIESS